MNDNSALEKRILAGNKRELLQTLYTVVSAALICEIAGGIAYLIQHSSTFSLGVSEQTEWTLLNMFAATVVIKSILMLASEKSAKRLKRDIKYLVLALIIAGVFFASYYSLTKQEGGVSYRYEVLLFTALMVIGTVGIDYNKLLRLYVIAAAFVMAVIVTAAICGAITNYVYIKDFHVRSSWGIGYPTDLASYFFYICVFYWAAFCKKNDIRFIIPTLFALLIAHYVARSETSTMCDIAFLALIILNWFFQQNRLKIIKKIIDTITVWAFPAFTLLMMALLFAYLKGNGIAIKINGLISNRISLAADAYREFGLSMFGAPLRQIGAGGGNFAASGYDFVDSTYHLLLLNFGIIVLVMVNILWVLMTRKAIRTGDRRLAIGMALIAFHSLSEHHFIEPNFNILIAMPVSVLMGKAVAEKERTEQTSEQRKEILLRKPKPGMIIAAMIILFFTAAFAHRMLPWTRTFFSCSPLTDTTAGRRLLFVAIVVLVLGVILSLYCVYRLIKEIHTKQNRSKIRIYAAILLLIIIAGIGLLWKSNNYLVEEYKNRTDEINSDREAIDIIKEAHGKIYVYGLPEFYKREFGGISTSLFDGEELARYRNITVVVDKNLDSPIFFGRGFLYTPVSDYHSIYTNDETVIEALEEKGYRIHGFYCIPSYVDLNSEEDGPSYDLREGRYTATFDLTLDMDSIEGMPDDTEIAVIEVSKEGGKEDILSVPVLIDQFDEEGNGKIEAVYFILDSKAVEFKIKPSEGISLSVISIENKKTPEYDSRRVYNSKGQIIHEEYYDLDGNKITTASGYAAKDIGYDKKGNPNHEIYYDIADNKALNNCGFNEIIKTFDKEGKVVREEYYDLNSNPCNCTEGYAVKTYEYEKDIYSVTQRFFDDMDNPVLNIYGFAGIKRRKDEVGRIIREEYYGLDDNPIAIGDGQVIKEYEYEGNSWTPVKVRLYDINGREIEQ